MSRKIMRKGITNRVRRYCYRRFSFPVTPGKVSFGDLYGIFYQCNYYTEDPGRSNRGGSWRMGCHQPSGRLWQRQPCDTFVSEKLAHKVEGQL